MVLLNDTNQLIARSNVRPAKDPLYPNLRLRPETDDLHVPHVGLLPGFKDPTPTTSHPPNPTPVTVETVPDDTDDTVSPTVPSGKTDPSEASKPHITNIQDYYDVPVRLLRFSPDDFIGLTFLHDVEDGQKVRAKIVKKILDKDAENHKNIKMLVSYDDGRIEELITYNELCDIVAEQHDREESGDMETFTFREVLDLRF